MVPAIVSKKYWSGIPSPGVIKLKSLWVVVNVFALKAILQPAFRTDAACAHGFTVLDPIGQDLATLGPQQKALILEVSCCLYCIQLNCTF